MTFLELAACCACIAVLELDTVQIGQFMISRPSIAGMLAGLFTGRPAEGVQIGLWTELLFLDQIPMGGVVPPSGLVAASSAVFLLDYPGLEVPAAFIIGVMLGHIYSRVEVFARGRRSSWNRGIDAEISGGRERLGFWVTKSFIAQFFTCGFFLLFGVVFAGRAGKFIWGLSSQEFRGAAYFAYATVPWLGLAALVLRFRPGGNR